MWSAVTLDDETVSNATAVFCMLRQMFGFSDLNRLDSWRKETAKIRRRDPSKRKSAWVAKQAGGGHVCELKSTNWIDVCFNRKHAKNDTNCMPSTHHEDATYSQETIVSLFQRFFTYSGGNLSCRPSPNLSTLRPKPNFSATQLNQRPAADAFFCSPSRSYQFNLNFKMFVVNTHFSKCMNNF